MKIGFKNDISIESIVKRFNREEKQIAKMLEQIKYWRRNPDKYIEFITGVKLSWYRKVWIRLEFMRRRIL